MKNVFKGATYGTIKCKNLDELQKAIISGGYFKRTPNDDFYYRAVPCSQYLPDDVVLLERRCTTSKTTYCTFFYKIEKDEKEKIYSGKNLENVILKNVEDWAREIKPETMTAFHGKRFRSFINAIPEEFLCKDKFFDKLKSSLKKGFIKRFGDNFKNENVQNFVKACQKVIIDKQKEQKERI